MKNNILKNKNIINENAIFIYIVNINDIEDIILTKSQIDIDDDEVEYRSNLQEFINTQCVLDTILTNGTDIMISFKLSIIFGKTYLFCSYTTDKEKSMLLDYLKSINYNINSLKKLTYQETISSELDYINSGKNLYIIKDNNYYI